MNEKDISVAIQECENSVAVFEFIQSSLGEDFFHILQKGKIINDITDMIDCLDVDELENIYDICRNAWLVDDNNIDLENFIYHTVDGLADNLYTLDVLQQADKWDILGDYYNGDHYYLKKAQQSLDNQQDTINIKR